MNFLCSWSCLTVNLVISQKLQSGHLGVSLLNQLAKHLCKPVKFTLSHVRKPPKKSGTAKLGSVSWEHFWGSDNNIVGHLRLYFSKDCLFSEVNWINVNCYWNLNICLIKILQWFWMSEWFSVIITHCLHLQSNREPRVIAAPLSSI